MRSGEWVGSRHMRLRADGQVGLGLAALHANGRAGQIATCDTVSDWVKWSGRELQHCECCNWMG